MILWNNLAESNLFLLVAFFPLPLLLRPIISLPIKDVTDAKSNFQGVYQKIYSDSTSGTRLMIRIVTKNSTKSETTSSCLKTNRFEGILEQTK